MSARKKCWSQSFGTYGSTIRVAEREPGGVLYVLFVDNQGKQQKRTLGHRDRRRARALAREMAERLVAARAAARAVRRTTPSVGELTLAEGIDLAFDSKEGLYPSETRHKHESRRLLDRAVAVLGPRLTWSELKPRKVRLLVRTLAERSSDGKGARTAELMCDMLYTVAAFLRDEEMIPSRAAFPGRNWKVRLKSDWEAMTGANVKASRLRHSVDEIGRIFAALPQADPRLHLLIELAAELRAGQAVRARRSDLCLEQVGGFALGRFTVRGSGRKLGEVVDLHPELRDLVDRVLSVGYLAEAEAAYRGGEVSDYYLFPAGRLRAGKVKVEACNASPLGEKSIREMFRRLEELAGVEHREGRAFYGLRRTATDVAPDFESDDRVLDRLTGHRDSATRKQVYQDRESEEIGARAARVRRAMREHLKERGQTAG